MTVILKPRRPGSNAERYLEFTSERQQKALQLSTRLIAQLSVIQNERRVIIDQIYKRRDELTDEMYDGKRAWGEESDTLLDELLRQKTILDKRRISLRMRHNLVLDTAQSYGSRAIREICGD